MTVTDSHSKKSRRPGFTLVEMMTVIVIIGILAGFVVGAVIAARKAAVRAVIVAEMKQLEMALQSYKGEVGEFPPDFAFCDVPAPDPVGIAARARVVRHLRKAFPRMRLQGAGTDAQFGTFFNYLRTNYPSFIDSVDDLNPSTALAFWLGGPPDTTGQLSGFNEDPANPFKPAGTRRKPYFDFVRERLAGFQYLQPKVEPQSPYVYFRAIKNIKTGFFEYGVADASENFTPYSFGDNTNMCVPYLEDAYDLIPNQLINSLAAAEPARVWRAPDTYQILAAGLDGNFGSFSPPVATNDPRNFRFSKLGENFTDGDYDNLASFAENELEKEL